MNACTQCGESYTANQLVPIRGELICANCKPIFEQRLREGLGGSRAFRYGGFWMRFLALILDSILLYIANLIIMLPLGLLFSGGDGSGVQVAAMGLIYFAGLAIGVTYEAYFVSRFAATPGKMVCKLQVLRPDGSRLTFGRGVGRYFAKILSSLTFMIGFVMAGFDDEKRALHDRICDSRVVYGK